MAPPNRAQDGDVYQTGYEGVYNDPKPEGPVKWELRRIPHWSGSDIACALFVDNGPRGLITLKSEEEYEWLKDRLEKT